MMTQEVPHAASDMQIPLDGVRVLDFTAVMSGPFCTVMLADMGADVVKVEPPRGDDTRQVVRYPGRGAQDEDYFYVNNRSKKSISLNLKNPSARAVVHELAKQADVVVENYAPGTAARLGIGWDDLHPLNDKLVYCSISGFGQDGPYRDRLALDPIVQGYAGMMSITGQPGGPPTLTGGSITDTISGMTAAFAIVSALYAVRQDGRGRYIDLSMQAAAMAAISARMGEYLQAGRVPARAGNRSTIRIPANAYVCSDSRYVQLLVLHDRHWPALCRALGREDWLENTQWHQVAGRKADQDHMHQMVANEMKKRPAKVWLERMVAERLPAAPINDYSDAANDPQVVYRGLIRTLDHPVSGPIRVVGPGWKMTGPESEMRPPPRLNQHMDEVFKSWLGWNEGQITAVKKAIGTHG